MNTKVLFVDDEEKVLASFRRNLAGLYEVAAVSSAKQGLEMLREKGPFAVVVSDLKMPKMDGVEFLSKVRSLYPDTVRVMLTGYADLDSAIAAVNEDQIFRFLTKPCENRRLIQILDVCFEQYRLVLTERELLQGTLRGSIKILTDVLSLLKPEVYGRVNRIIPYVRKISKLMENANPWQNETAARLALLGFVTLPDSIIKRLNAGRPLSPEEMKVYSRHPAVAVKLLSNIPRMEALAPIITYQNKHYDGSGMPYDNVRWEKIPLGARILKAVLDFDSEMSKKATSKKEALAAMRRSVGVYDPKVLDALERVLGDEAHYNVLTLSIAELRNRMILMEDIQVARGGKYIRVLSRGQEINETTKEYLKKYLDQGYIGKSVKVVEPVDSEEQEERKERQELKGGRV